MQLLNLRTLYTLNRDAQELTNFKNKEQVKDFDLIRKQLIQKLLEVEICLTKLTVKSVLPVSFTSVPFDINEY